MSDKKRGLFVPASVFTFFGGLICGGILAACITLTATGAWDRSFGAFIFIASLLALGTFAMSWAAGS